MEMIDDKNTKNSATEIKKLSKTAEVFISELYGKFGQFQIEEVRKSENDKNWVLTVSYFQKHESPNDLQKLMGLFGNRVYKQLVIKSDGTVVSIANWYPEHAVAL